MLTGGAHGESSADVLQPAVRRGREEPGSATPVRSSPRPSRAAATSLSERLFQVVADAPKTAAMLEQGGVEFVLQAEKRPLVDYLRAAIPDRGGALRAALRRREAEAAPSRAAARRRATSVPGADGRPSSSGRSATSLAPTVSRGRPWRARRRPRAHVRARWSRRAGAPRACSSSATACTSTSSRSRSRRWRRRGSRSSRRSRPSKNPIQLQREIGALDPTRYCAVFYSPFTYEFVPPLETFQRMGMAARTPWRAPRAAAEAFAQVAPTLRLLAERFECPVIVHNTAQVTRIDGSPRSAVRRRLTWPGRRRLAAALNARVEAGRRGAQPEHVRAPPRAGRDVVAARLRRRSLGRYLHAAEYQHPAVLGQLLAEAYVDVIATVTDLLDKKLVACDLDNTLWEGLIGEGAVRHHLDRQRTLAALRQKGVVLAIESKNDPGTCTSTAASWAPTTSCTARSTGTPKAINIRRIAETLNLKAKDFVFVDDRPDERDLVTRGVPGVTALDATSARTWRSARAVGAAGAGQRDRSHRDVPPVPGAPGGHRGAATRSTRRRCSRVSGWWCASARRRRTT